MSVTVSSRTAAARWVPPTDSRCQWTSRPVRLRAHSETECLGYFHDCTHKLQSLFTPTLYFNSPDDQRRVQHVWDHQVAARTEDVHGADASKCQAFSSSSVFSFIHVIWQDRCMYTLPDSSVFKQKCQTVTVDSCSDRCAPCCRLERKLQRQHTRTYAHIHTHRHRHRHTHAYRHTHTHTNTNTHTHTHKPNNNNKPVTIN